MKIGNVYWDWREMHEDLVQPSVLAIGDSWFWYPFGGSLIVPVARQLRDEHVVYAIGNNGAEAYDYVSGKYRKIVKGAVERYGSGLSAVFISGGGNDFAGFNDLGPLLNFNCSASTTPEGCFREGAAGQTLAWLLHKMSDSYRALIGMVMSYTTPGTKIFLHNYDYAFPTGRGVLGFEGGWLKPALAHAQVPDSLQRDCVKYLIDELTDSFTRLVDIDPARIVLVRSAGTLGEHDWVDELHPTPGGFVKIASQCWAPALAEHGLSA